MTLFRIPLLAIPGLGLLMMLPAEARLGETVEECDSRYGAPVAEIPARLENASCRAYSKDGVRVRVEFVANRAAFISFSSPGQQLAISQELLALNSGNLTWSSPVEFVGRLSWIAPSTAAEPSRHASAYQIGKMGFLDLATADWARAMKSQQAVQFAVVPGVAAPRKPVAPGQPEPAVPKASGKLKGF